MKRRAHNAKSRICYIYKKCRPIRWFGPCKASAHGPIDAQWKAKCPDHAGVYVPTTSVKNGYTLKLSDLSWSVTGTSLADDTLVPTSYTATATYSTTASRSVATGYVTTAKYTGEITAEGISSIEYTVTYLGTPLEVDSSLSISWLVIPGAALILLAAVTGIIWALCLRANATIYAMNAKGVAYKNSVGSGLPSASHGWTLQNSKSTLPARQVSS